MPRLLFLLFFFGSSLCLASKDSTEALFNALEQEYKRQEINEKEYLKKTDNLILKLFTQGYTFSCTELIHYFSLYREIAWGNKDFQYNRGSYYRHLMNNADLRGKGGEAVFFAEKYSVEMEQGQGRNILPVAYIRTVFFNQNKNFARAVTVFEETKDYMLRLVDKTNSPAFDLDETMQGIQLYSTILHAYLELDNRKAATEVLKNAVYLNAALQKLDIADAPKAASTTLIRLMEAELALYDENYTQARTSLRSGQQTLRANREKMGDIAAFFESSVSEWWLKYYISTRNIDSSRHYLALREKAGSHFSDDADFLYRNKALIATYENDYKAAYDTLRLAINFLDQQNEELSNEVNELMYSHLESEYSRNILSHAEKVQKKQRLFLLAFAVALPLIALASFALLRHQKRKAARRIQALRHLTEIEINEIRNQTQKEATKKLGRDLHDDLSSSLAALLHQLEYIEKESEKENIKEALQQVRNKTTNIYHTVRNKSHSLYFTTHEEVQQDFGTSIKKIVDVILPTHLKEIDIDPSSAALLSLEQRIEIMRIVQESAINVLTHAKDANEVFVFLYTDKNDTVVFRMGDNGRSFKKGKKGLGLTSIQQRAQELNGTLDLEWDNGMIITLTIPVKA